MKIIPIRGVGKLHVCRTEQFLYKQIVSDFITEVIKLSAKNARTHVDVTKYATFCHGELQMHSIIVPALAKLSDCLILEYPIQRGQDDNSGRVDYYCANNVGKPNEYRLFLELKCGKQGIPCSSFRQENIDLWYNVNTQLEGIAQEIQQNGDFHNKPNIRVCMEVITLYADESRSGQIDTAILLSAFETSINALVSSNVGTPNISVLLEFNQELRDNAKYEYNFSRKFFGLLFLCRIMPSIEPV